MVYVKVFTSSGCGFDLWYMSRSLHPVVVVKTTTTGCKDIDIYHKSKPQPLDVKTLTYTVNQSHNHWM
jgi:hypothetical protein